MRSEAKHNRLHLTPPRWLPDGSVRSLPLAPRPTCAAWPFKPVPFGLDEVSHLGDVLDASVSGDPKGVSQTRRVSTFAWGPAEPQASAPRCVLVSASVRIANLTPVSLGSFGCEGLKGLRQTEEFCVLSVRSDPNDRPVVSRPDRKLHKGPRRQRHRKRRRWTFGALRGACRRWRSYGSPDPVTRRGRGPAEVCF